MPWDREPIPEAFERLFLWQTEGCSSSRLLGLLGWTD